MDQVLDITNTNEPNLGLPNRLKWAYYRTVEQNNGPTVARTEETVGTTLMVPVDTWKALRTLATDRRVSQQSLWLQAMTEFLERNPVA
jgi:hypothetical protein